VKRLLYFSFALVLINIVFLTYVWLQQPVSNQELVANFAKAGDFFRAAKSMGGIPWWSPMFMQGTSLAMDWSFMLTNAVLLAFSGTLGFLVGPKVAVATCLALGSLGMISFLHRYTGNRLSAVLGGFLFLCFPAVLTRALGFEHFVVLMSLALLPWVLWSLIGLVRFPSPRSAVLFALAFSALMMAYGKTGLMATPVLMAFGVTEYILTNQKKRSDLWVFALAGFVIFWLAVVPNLPTLREVHFITIFDLGPFEGWQRAFSTKSALSWLDRDGILGNGMGQGFAPTTLNGGTYIGLTTFFIWALALGGRKLEGSVVGHQSRILIGLAMFAFWLSFGPRSVLGGHMEFLGLSMEASDFLPALGWFLLVGQVWIVFRLLAPKGNWGIALATGIAIVYLVVPGFRLLEILPLYKNIRAPFDFFQITGAICFIAGSALAAGVLLERLPWRFAKIAAATVLILFAAWDAAPYARPIFQPQMDRAVFNDFLATQTFLKSAPQSGSVYAFSGRYFYLLTPWISGRPLANEAFNSYLQQRGAAVLQSSAMLSEESWKSYLRIAGVAYLLIDKTDPDNPKELQEKMRLNFKTAFENDNMAVLTVPEALGPCFLARDFVQAPNDDASSAMGSLGAARYNYAAIQLPSADLEAPGYQGKIVDGRILPKEKAAIQEGAHFLSVPQKSGGNYQRVTFAASQKPGWLVFNQAWHPDWVAIQDGKVEKPQRAFLAFSAVQTDGTHEVTFEFREPWWYNFCIYIGFASWLVALGFLITGGGRLSMECTQNSDTLKL
jgi:hypothetical protein